MTAGPALSAGRAMAEALMQDTCIVQFQDGTSEPDPETLEETPVWSTRLTSKCKVQLAGVSQGTSDSVVAERVQATARAQLHFPVAVTGIQVGDLVTIAAIGTATMPQVLGRKFRVTGFNPKSWATALRVDVEDVL